jgi:predicted HTH transcriptional regulator
MLSNPKVTVKMLSASLGISDRNVKNHIKALKNAGVIEHIGPTKNGAGW